MFNGLGSFVDVCFLDSSRNHIATSKIHSNHLQGWEGTKNPFCRGKLEWLLDLAADHFFPLCCLATWFLLCLYERIYLFVETQNLRPDDLLAIAKKKKITRTYIHTILKLEGKSAESLTKNGLAQ